MSGQESEEIPEPSFVQRGALSFKTMLREAADYKALRSSPYGLKPVLVLTTLGAVVSFNRAISGVALPAIIRGLGTDIDETFRVLSLVGFVGIAATLTIAFLGDRLKRVRLLGIQVFVAGVFSFLTGRANGIWSFGAARAGFDLGQEALGEGIPTTSLQADYYPPELRGKVFALRGVTAFALISAAPLIIGALVEKVGWRTPYAIGGVAAIACSLLVLTLKEPIRGYMERKSLGASEEEAVKPQEVPSLGEAWRSIWGIRTMRRLFMATIPATAGSFTFSFYFAILMFDYYHLSIFQISILTTVLAVASLPFGFLGGGLVDVLVRRRPQRVLLFTGLLGFLAAPIVAVMALGPPLWVIVATLVAFGAVGALINPARQVLIAQILPAHVRTMGLSLDTIAGVPGTIIRIYTIGFFVSRWGIQGGLFAAVPFFFLTAVIQLSAAGFFERDMKAAMASQMATEEYKRARERGRGKLLVCREVDVEYDGVQVLFGVDFDVEDGQIIAVLGTNGAGKSTLLKAISGVQEASGGAIVLDGRDITHMPPAEIANRGVVHMPGGRGIFPGLNVKENLMLGGWTASESDVKARIDDVYQLFPVLADRKNTVAGLLSGGEQQMLSLAQAFLSRPHLLMIDELSLGLAPSVIEQLIEVVKKIHEQGATVILVEQSVNIALTIADSAIFMEKGEVKFIGETAELLNRPDILRAVYVKGTGALMDPKDSALQSDRDRRRGSLSWARPILEVRNASKNFGGVVALDEVSLGLREGEILGLVGPNGAGKTTLLDVVAGYLPADAGQILFGGTDITSLGPEDRAERGIVRRFQDARLIPSLTLYENLLLALDRGLDARNLVLVALQMPNVRQGERRIRLRADRIIDLLRLGDYRDKFVRELSTGLRRMADLACVLATEPKLLLLDEPSTGIAQAEAEGLGPLLRRIRFETGCSMLIIEHDMVLISGLADELVVMDQARVLTRGVAEEVLNDERVITAYLGTSEEVIRRQGAVK